MGVGPLRRGVFLDRDGVINAMWHDAEHGTVDSPANPEQWMMLDGVAAAIARLNGAGFAVAVVSNQPGIAKRKLTPALLDAITRCMRAGLAAEGARLDGVYYCLHHPDAVIPEYRVACDCRKPAPGLLRRAASELDVDLASSYMIGDGVTDVQAGNRAGCTTIWIGARKCDVCALMRTPEATPRLTAPDLAAAVDLLLGVRPGRHRHPA
jgi:D-glycero-D-manno-heptose 1,7-bisphosphate phosphatase